ncbi:rpr domain-containing protein [Cryptosporidium ubiquitum]|uniref:Rpr domain-containing protein n=1 Tax=Cryptosporidium ubiquitum TaxID=857276 RepID=A0A1J4MPV0_9CRYT|nr:rpr domain-containing protein [Cryptosporidium ubiquitum]OII74901.1 rpr domain-containing protein [Cryptosporidium ubiquitum]
MPFFTYNGFNTEEFESQLHLFAQKLQTINTQQDVICALSESIICIKENTVILQLYMRVVEEYSSRAPPEHLIPLVYILNDFAQKCKSQAHYTSEALFNIFNQINLYHTEYMAKARRCYNIWKIREIFDADTLRRLDCALLGLTPPVPSTLSHGYSKELQGFSSESNNRTNINNLAISFQTNKANNDTEKEAKYLQKQYNSGNKEDLKLKNGYLSLCASVDNVLKDAASIREKRKIIQSICSTANKTSKLSNNEKLLKLIEMEWELRCNICLNLQETLNLLDHLHSEVIIRLSDTVEALQG